MRWSLESRAQGNSSGCPRLSRSDGTICALARGLKFPSAVALGRGAAGFSAGNLYAVTFSGDIVALPNAAR